MQLFVGFCAFHEVLLASSADNDFFKSQDGGVGSFYFAAVWNVICATFVLPVLRGLPDSDGWFSRWASSVQRSCRKLQGGGLHPDYCGGYCSCCTQLDRRRLDVAGTKNNCIKVMSRVKKWVTINKED